MPKDAGNEETAASVREAERADEGLALFEEGVGVNMIFSSDRIQTVTAAVRLWTKIKSRLFYLESRFLVT